MWCLRSPWPDPCSVLNPPGDAQQPGGRTRIAAPVRRCGSAGGNHAFVTLFMECAETSCLIEGERPARTAHRAYAPGSAGSPPPRFLGSRSPTQRPSEQKALKAITKKDAPAD